MIFIQIFIALITKNETNIKNKFKDHYFIVKLLQYGLLYISIKYNYIFFSEGSKGFSFTVLVLCILFDLGIIKCISLSSDLRRLNYHKDKDYKATNNLLMMIIFNLLSGLRIKTIKDYKNNLRTLNNVLNNNNETLITDNQKQELENPKENETIIITDIQETIKPNKVKDIPKLDKKEVLKIESPKVVKDNPKDNKPNIFKPSDLEKDILKVKDYLKIKYTDNDCINMTDLASEFNYNEYKLKKVKELLKEQGITYTNGKKTYLSHQENKLIAVR
jgi:hypothetical protein